MWEQNMISESIDSGLRWYHFQRERAAYNVQLLETFSANKVSADLNPSLSACVAEQILYNAEDFLLLFVVTSWASDENGLGWIKNQILRHEADGSEGKYSIDNIERRIASNLPARHPNKLRIDAQAHFERLNGKSFTLKDTEHFKELRNTRLAHYSELNSNLGRLDLCKLIEAARFTVDRIEYLNSCWHSKITTGAEGLAKAASQNLWSALVQYEAGKKNDPEA